jgi:hypothetical protein
MAVRVSVDTDTWWHLRAGSWIVEHRQILRSDPFSLTRQGQPWIYPGWLSQVVIFGVYQGLGFAGLNLLTGMMVTLAFLAIWQLLEGPLLLRSTVALIAATVSGVYWSARPQIFSFVFTGLTLLILEKAAKGRRGWLVALPPLMALWSNLHGGFAIGFILMICYFLGEIFTMLGKTGLKISGLKEAWRGRRGWLVALSIAGIACALFVGINPHGFQMLLYPFKTVSIGVLQDYIQEWQSPNFHRVEAQPFIWMLILTLISLAKSRIHARPVELLLVSVFAYLSLMAGRNIALFAVVTAPILARHADSSLEPLLETRDEGRQLPERFTRVANAVFFSLLLIAAILKITPLLSLETNQQAIADRNPVEAVEALLVSEPPGELFNSYNWGGYVLWQLYPAYRSFVDGRTDLFNDDILQEYLLAWRAEAGWESVLDSWGIQVVLIEPQAPLVRALEYEGWMTLYADEQAVVLSIQAGRD